MNHVFAYASFAQKFRSLDAMLLRIQLKVNVVEQSDHSPEIHFVGKAQLHGIPGSPPPIGGLASARGQNESLLYFLSNSQAASLVI